ncbi:MAG: cysteine--tRNA ligase [Thermodesulfovibrionales bacterium]
MLRLYNTLSRRIEPFRPAHTPVGVFTCGPSVYQRAHIGNWRTFLFEDILVRYLEYRGYRVKRGMNITDIEDKAVAEAKKRRTTVQKLTDRNIRQFLREMRRLRMQTPDYLPRASEHVLSAVKLIQMLLRKKVAYWHGGNVYFDPLRFTGFGKLYGLDMKRWPKKLRRFHRDTYPGIQWNLGDFILWHGRRQCDTDCWDTEIGPGRPSWNIQDASMISDFFDRTLSVYCGGIDNLYRHHDYSIAILESVRPYPMARYWLHGGHLFVDGRKMSKSLGNIIHADDLAARGFSYHEIRYFLMSRHYREKLNFTDAAMRNAALRLRALRRLAGRIRKMAGAARPQQSRFADEVRAAFEQGMDNDLNAPEAVNRMSAVLRNHDISELSAAEAAGVVTAIRDADHVLQVLF